MKLETLKTQDGKEWVSMTGFKPICRQNKVDKARKSGMKMNFKQKR